MAVDQAHRVIVHHPSAAQTKRATENLRFHRSELLIWLLILGAPSNHAGRKPILIRRGALD